MKIIQKEIILNSRSRGFHVVTDEVISSLPELKSIKAGIAHIHILHTSASLSLNENADPTVRTDMENFFSRLLPENEMSFYEHTLEGPDDMTSHIKNTIIGSSVTVPVTNGRFNLGTWQGIYLCEHRNNARSRKIIVTVTGE